MTLRCPSELALERYLLEAGSPQDAAHLATCSACRARLARMEEEGRYFLAHVFPRTVAKVEAAVQRRARWGLPTRLLVPAAAALAAVLFVLRPSPEAVGLDADRTQLKGGGSLQLDVFVGAPEGARRLADGAAVPAGAAIRFQVRSATPCRAWIASVDATGGVSRLYPLTGEDGAEIVTATVLPGGAVLDGVNGPERFFAFCSPDGVGYATVERALRRAITHGERNVRSVSAVPGLPRGTAQHSVLVEKRT